MKKFLTYLFVFFGMLFVLEFGALAYLWFADPFGVRPLIIMLVTKPAGDAVQPVSSTPAGTDKNPALSPAQEAALEKIGVDPAKVPTSISADMKACFVAKLGAARVAEIQNGAAPTPGEVLTTSPCYSAKTK